MRVNGLCELTLETPDPLRLARFYAEVFGLPLLSYEGDRVWLGCGEQARLGLWSPGEKEFGDRGGRHVHFAVSVGHGELLAVRGPLRAPGGAPRGPGEDEGGGPPPLFEEAPGDP